MPRLALNHFMFQAPGLWVSRRKVDTNRLLQTNSGQRPDRRQNDPLAPHILDRSSIAPGAQERCTPIRQGRTRSILQTIDRGALCSRRKSIASHRPNTARYRSRLCEPVLAPLHSHCTLEVYAEGNCAQEGFGAHETNEICSSAPRTVTAFHLTIFRGSTLGFQTGSVGY